MRARLGPGPGADRRSPSPSGAPDTSPFCEVTAYARGPLGAETPEYLIVLESSIPGAMSVHVTLIADSGAYDALLPQMTLVPDTDRFALPKRTVVTLPSGTAVNYAFVDSYTIAGKEKVICPTQPSAVNPNLPSPGPASSDGLMPVAATFLQALPPMACGKTYTMAHVKGFSPHTGFYGNKELTTELHIYIDSGGNLVKTSIWKSSGVKGVDDMAMNSAEQSTYTAATFLCTPVVGSFLFKFTYKP